MIIGKGVKVDEGGDKEGLVIWKSVLSKKILVSSEQKYLFARNLSLTWSLIMMVSKAVAFLWA